MGDEKGECEYNKELDILRVQPGDFHSPPSLHSKKKSLPFLTFPEQQILVSMWVTSGGED